MSERTNPIVEAVSRAKLLRYYCLGIKPGWESGIWDPVYPHHGAPRRCPFCGTQYIRHGGHADHRDRCQEGPNPGANPANVGGTSE